jgi:hypothetical protein
MLMPNTLHAILLSLYHVNFPKAILVGPVGISPDPAGRASTGHRVVQTPGEAIAAHRGPLGGDGRRGPRWDGLFGVNLSKTNGDLT